MSQLSGSVTLDVELGRISDALVRRLLDAAHDAGLVEQVAQQLAMHLAVPPTLYDKAVVACVDRWDTDQPGWHGFEFRASPPATGFVLYAPSPDQYAPGVSYTLAVSVTPTSGVGDQPVRATVPIPELAPHDPGGQPGEAGLEQVSWFGGDGDQ